MKERPIIFSGPMVRAILEGKKTQTRRGIKPQPDEDGLARELSSMDWFDTSGRVYACPYGRVGDRLWVRETWQKNYGTAGGLIYRADHGEAEAVYVADDQTGKWSVCCSGWKSPIYLPRLNSRITLEITGVRVERLQEISEADAWKEGFPDPDGKNKEYTDRARYWFRTVWEDINGPSSWDTNPWVWVLDFKKAED